MVKALFLGLLVATICGFVFAAPASELPFGAAPEPLVEDPAARSERSTNLSHVTGTARKIQMFIKNRHLQLLPDGTVNGTTDDTSAFTILQRTTVGIGQMKIQGVATCQYLCMDACGLLYGSSEFGEECIFNETIEQTNYNTYSSTKYSNDKRTFYLALNRRGQSRKVVIRAQQQLGRLSSYTRVLTRTVSPELSLHPMRHGHICPGGLVTPTHSPYIPTSTNDPPRCRRRRKKKKKKRKCTEDETDGRSGACQHHPKRQGSGNATKLGLKRPQHHKCAANASEECQKDVTIKKRPKFNNSEKLLAGIQKKKKRNKKGNKKRLHDQVDPNEELSAPTTTMITPTSTIFPEEIVPDEDYAVESSTQLEWEEPTVVPDVSMAVSDVIRKTSTRTDVD